MKYQCYQGEGNVVMLILTGVGGSLNGYQNKYQKIAQTVLDLKQGSVFVFGLEDDAWIHSAALVEETIKTVKEEMKSRGVSDPIIYTMGVSAGASLFGMYGYLYPEVKRMLLINPVLQVNYPRLKKGILSTKADITFVFGTKDPSYPYVPLLKNCDKENLEVLCYENANHWFAGDEMTELFIRLPQKILFRKED